MAQPPFNQDPYGHNPYQAPGSNLYTQEEHGDKLTIDQAIESGYDYDVLAILSEAWAATNGFKLTIFLASLVFMGVGILSYLIIAVLAGISIAILGMSTGVVITAIIGMLVMMVVFWLLSAGPYTMTLNHLRNRTVELNQIFSGFSRAKPVLAFSILIFIFSLAGSIPNLIFANSSGAMATLAGLISNVVTICLTVTYSLTICIIMDHPEVTFWEAMEGSRKLIMQHWFKMLLVFIALIAINIIGALLLLIGLFWTIPMTFLAIGCVYRTIFQA